MAPTPEDKRAAVGIKVALSGALTSAALAVLGAEAAIATFVIDKQDHLGWFYMIAALGWLALMTSMFIGGRGIAQEYKSGFSGDWQEKASGNKFAYQTLLALVGVTLVFASAFVGTPKATEAEKQQQSILRSLAETTAQIKDLQHRVEATETELKAMRSKAQSVGSPAGHPGSKTKAAPRR